jgi:1-deoxy-D-xylulose-5-phosphate reductoisomerase
VNEFTKDLPRVAVLGATGSIGDAFFKLLRLHPNLVNIVAIAVGTNFEKALKIAEEFGSNILAIENLGATPRTLIEVSCKEVSIDLFVGSSAAERAIEESNPDIVVCAITGIAGLRSCYKAVQLGKKILLANKESLVCAGDLIMSTAATTKAQIIPIDSEHSALDQLLGGKGIGGNLSPEINRLILTASGGPFYNYRVEDLADVTPEQAVKHPRWNMGAKISVDSATMVNKALEIAEAYWLFDIAPDKIDAIIHPQSIVHSLIEFRDGVQLAQLSDTDMLGPISFGLSKALAVERFANVLKTLSFDQLQQLNFYPLPSERFPAIGMMKKCLNDGLALSAIFNSANEFAVEFFLKKKIKFLAIADCIELALNSFSGRSYSSVEELLDLHQEIHRFLVTKFLAS